MPVMTIKVEHKAQNIRLAPRPKKNQRAQETLTFDYDRKDVCSLPVHQL